MATLPIFLKYILTGLIGMVPIIELRGAIPIGVGAFHLNYVEAFLCSFIGNIIPVYFIVKYIRPLFDFLEDGNLLRKLSIGLQKKQINISQKTTNYKQL